MQMRRQFAGILLAILVLPPAGLFGQNAADYIHAGTHLIIPAKLAGFQRGRLTRFPNGTDICLNFRGPHKIALDLYVYPAPPDAAGPGENEPGSKTFSKHFQQVLAAVKLSYRKVRVLGQETYQILPRTGGPWVRRALIELEFRGFKAHSQAHLLVMHGRYIKFRITYPAENKEAAQPAVEKFIHALEWQQATPAEVKAQQQIIAKAIAAFTANPLAAAKDARTFMRYWAESDFVSVEVSRELLPWTARKPLSDPGRILFYAYVAGDLEAQFKRGKPGNDSLAGIKMVFRVYRQLQAQDEDLKLAEIEKLLELENEGKLKEHLRALGTPAP